jgi:hypothetical protein
MVKKKVKGGVAFIDTNAATCNNKRMCNLNDIKFATDYYHPTEFNNIDDRPTNFALPSNMLGGKKKKGGGDIPSRTSLYDVRNLNYTNTFKAMEYGNFDDRPTNFALSSTYFGGDNKKKYNVLKKEVYKLLFTSYKNYKNNKKIGGNLGDSALKTFNTNDLNYTKPFTIQKLEKLNYVPQSNFQI